MALLAMLPFLAAEQSAEADEPALRLLPGMTAEIIETGPGKVVELRRDAVAAAVGRLRTGRHPGFGRLVIEPPPGATVSLGRSGELLTIDAGFALPADAAQRVQALGAPIVAAERDGARLILEVTPGAGLDTAGSTPKRLILDLRVPSRPGSPAGRTPPIPQPRPVLTAPPAVSPSTMAELIPEPGAGPALVAKLDAAASAGGPGLVDAAMSPRLRARPAGDGAELDIVWPEPVPAAAFARAGYLWLVFGRAGGELPLAAITAAPATSRWLESLTQVQQDGLTVLKLRARPDGAAMMRRNATWTLRLGSDRAALPRSPVAWPPQQGRVQVPGAAMLATIDDPVVGDRLGLALMLESGRGEPQARQSVDLELLASLQGVVWRALADDVTASLDSAGAVVGPPLAIVTADSPDPVPAQPMAVPHAPAPPDDGDRVQAPVEHRDVPPVEPTDSPRLSAMTAEAVTVAEPIAEESTPPRPMRGPIDLGSAALRPGETLRERRRALELAVGGATGERQAELRLDLARLLLAQELAAEAGASLAALGERDAGSAAGQALSGVAALLRGQWDAAARELGRTRLDGDAEVALWRAALAAAREDWPSAIADWRRSGGVPAGYPDGLRVRLGVAAARIELADGRSDAALAILDRLRDLPMADEQRGRIRLAEAMALDAQGAARSAGTALADAIGYGDRDTRLEAERIRTAWSLRDGGTTPEAALARLAAARPAWRGHPKEAALLSEIGRLRAGLDDMPGAMRAWQEALARTDDPRAADELRRQLRERVARSLLGDGAEPPLSPLRALALYRDQAALLPEGAGLAEVERRLATRLAQAGIEEPAAALLQQRLALAGSAEARAEAGAALAAARLADGDADSALQLLRSTGPEAGLPPILAEQRRGLRARAAAAVGASPVDVATGNEEARFDAAWRARDWEGIETAARSVLAEPSTEAGRSTAILGLALAQARRGAGDELAATVTQHGPGLVAARDKALLAMLVAGSTPARGADLAPVEAGIGAVRAYLASAAGPP